MKDHIYRPRRLLSIFGPACLAEREKKLLATTDLREWRALTREFQAEASR